MCVFFNFKVYLFFLRALFWLFSQNNNKNNLMHWTNIKTNWSPPPLNLLQFFGGDQVSEFYSIYFHFTEKKQETNLFGNGHSRGLLFTRPFNHLSNLFLLRSVWNGPKLWWQWCCCSASSSAYAWPADFFSKRWQCSDLQIFVDFFLSTNYLGINLR